MVPLQFVPQSRVSLPPNRNARNTSVDSQSARVTLGAIAFRLLVKAMARLARILLAGTIFWGRTNVLGNGPCSYSLGESLQSLAPYDMIAPVAETGANRGV